MLCSQALQVWKHWTRDGLGRDYRNKRTIGLNISAKNTSKMHLFETVAMETEKTTLYTLRKIELFFILWIISDVESVNIFKLNSFSV